MYEKYRLPILAVLIIVIVAGLTVVTILISKWISLAISSLLIVETIRHLFDYDKHRVEVTTLQRVSSTLKTSSELYRTEKEKIVSTNDLHAHYLNAAEIELWEIINEISKHTELDEKTRDAIARNDPFFSPEVVTKAMSARLALKRLLEKKTGGEDVES